MMGEDIEDGKQPTASSILSEERRIAISGLVKVLAPLCSFHDLNFRNLVKKHELYVGEDLTRKMDSLQPDPPYNVRRD